ncbi:MAG: 2-oxoacid:acceptor oxidoreductase subunit alpha [Gammaproteobacteria bacterium]|nr:2-oxoacid:acceptor oxidoreductase subunit alpha [Gammaproteobacteria bacterium]
MNRPETRLPVEDLNIIVAGQGGDGSLTVINLLATVLQQSGLKVYTERDVLSRIKGGLTSATLRAFKGDRYCIGGHIDLLMAFDPDAIEKRAKQLAAGSIVIYDNSGGDIREGLLDPDVRVYGAPFARQAVKSFRRDLFKNSIGFAVAGRALGLADDFMRATFERRFARSGPQNLKYNLDALALGLALADELGMSAGHGLYEIVPTERHQRLLITGNDAAAFGFLAAGGRFFAGYPITPSTDVMEWLDKYIADFGGVVRQAEDELSAINMALGAALTGVRTMTATSGPGLSLMQEGIGQAGAAEIPLVVIDVQRGGPSTGLPTKPEQSDFDLMIFGGHGEFTRAVLAPGSTEDCFYLTALATELSQRYQMPIYVALDQALGQNSASVEPFDFSRVTVDNRPRYSAGEVAQRDIYKRYAFTENGVSPYTIPGTPDGMWLVTGNEHDEFGHVSAAPGNRKKQMDKRASKLVSMVPDLPRAGRYGDPTAKIGFIGVGLTYGTILEAMEALADHGIATQYFQPKTVWPVLDETLEFIASCDRVYVVEYNSTAQLAKLFVREGADGSKIENVLKYDGAVLQISELVAEVLSHEVAHYEREVNAA